MKVNWFFLPKKQCLVLARCRTVYLVGGHLAPFLYSSREPSKLSQWLCHDDSTINIVRSSWLLLLLLRIWQRNIWIYKLCSVSVELSVEYIDIVAACGIQGTTTTTTTTRTTTVSVEGPTVDNTTLIIAVAAVAGGFVLIVVIITIIVFRLRSSRWWVLPA